MRKNLTSVLIISCLFIPLTLKASDKVDMESFKRVGESIATGKQGLLTSHTSSGGAVKFTGEDGSSNITVSDAISFKGTDIKEKNYNAGNMYEAAREMANDPKSEHAEVVKDGFLRGKEFEVLNSDNFLDKARDVQANPEQYVDFLSGKYSDCEIKSEEIMDKKEVSCDEYTVHQSHMCSVGRKIEVDAKHNYVCKKERKTYGKKCTKELKISCENTEHCDAKGIVKDSINIQNVQWIYNYPRITLGTINIFQHGGMCEKRTATVKFTIKNKDVIDVFKLVHADYSDWLRVTINGTQVLNTMGGTESFYIKKGKFFHISDNTGSLGNQYDPVYSGEIWKTCNTKRFYNLPLNIDIRPYLKEGENAMVVELVFGNRGQLHLYMDTQQHCCSKWSDEEWIEKCEVVE